MIDTMRRIGELEVSVAGLGCNNFGMRIDEGATQTVVDAAIETGINFFDTADLYGGTKSEEFLGRVLGSRRDDVLLATKFGMLKPPEDSGLTGGKPAWVAQACEDSLRRLGTDRIDLYWLHAPDPETPIGDTLEALDQLVRDGKVRELGCSNFSAAQLDEAAAAAKEHGVRPFATVQNDYSLLQREPEKEVLPACARLGIAFVPYFPLASGLLTGKYKRGETPPEGTRLAQWGAPSDDRFAVVERLDAFATAHGHTLHELALSWLARRPEVASVIAGATKPEQVRANAAATTAWDLTDDELAEVDTLTAT